MRYQKDRKSKEVTLEPLKNYAIAVADETIRSSVEAVSQAAEYASKLI